MDKHNLILEIYNHIENNYKRYKKLNLINNDIIKFETGSTTSIITIDKNLFVKVKMTSNQYEYGIDKIFMLKELFGRMAKTIGENLLEEIEDMKYKLNKEISKKEDITFLY